MGSVATTYYPTNINVPRFDWASTATVAQKNVLRYTEDFDNAYWFKNNTTITANSTTAPDGTSSAELMTNAATTTVHAIQSNAGVLTPPDTATQYVFSCYLKKNTVRYVGFGWYRNSTETAGAGVDLDTGTITGVGAVGTGYTASNATITDVGSGWYRVSVVITGSTQLQFPSIGNRQTALTSGFYLESYAGSITESTYIWGAQLEVASSATAYQSVGAFTPTNTPLAANTTCNGLLIEESRTNRLLWCRDGLNGGAAVGTNFLLYSEQFQQSSWATVNSSVTANQTTAPDGTNTADQFLETVTNGSHGVYQNLASSAFAAGLTYVFSFYVKPINRDWCVINFYSGAASSFDYGMFFNLTGSGSVGLKYGTNIVAGKISAEANGFYRISITITLASSGSAPNIFIGSASADGTLSYAGDTTKGLYVWGASMITGSTLTDYQATTNTNVTGWSKSNVTVAKDQTGVDGVANAATKITASSDNGVLIQPMLLASGSRTGSVYLKRITGTGNVQVSLDGSTWSTVDLSSTEWRRIVLSGTVTNPTIGIRLATNGDAVAMDYGQIEDGAFATSPILTTTATVTRSADAASMSGANFFSWFRQNGGTIVAENTPLFVTTGANQSVWSIGDTPGSILRYDIRSGANNYVLSYRGANAVAVQIGTFTAGIKTKLAFTFGKVFSVAKDGTTVLTSTYGGDMPPLFIQFNIGTTGAGSYGNTTISKLIFSPTQTTNNGLLELSKS